jgi:hypothetical protein
LAYVINAMGLFDFLNKGKGGNKPSQNEGILGRSELQDRWLRDIETCCFSDQEKDGLYFFMGLVGDLYLKKRGLGGGAFNGYLSQAIECEDETESQYIDSEQIRSTLYTAAVILQEKWSKSDRPLSDSINVGAGYVFEGVLNEEMLEHFQELDFDAKSVDELFLAVFESFGECLSDNGVTGFKDCLKQGSELSSACLIDDARSSVYVFEKLITIIPPLFEALLNYPILYATNINAFKSNELFSMVLNHALNLRLGEEIKMALHRWHQYVFYDDKDAINAFWDFSADKHFSTLGSLALNGSNIKSQLNPEQLTAFLNNPNTLETDLKGKTISVKQYLGAIAQIMEIVYGYDLKESNWKNHGLYLQVICFFYIESCCYSVFPEAVKD